MWIKGSELTPSQRKDVLNAFPYRWTYENSQRTQAYKPCPLCDIRDPYVNPQSSEGHNHPTIPLIHDDEWLSQYAFHFVKDGSRMANNTHFCKPVSLL